MDLDALPLVEHVLGEPILPESHAGMADGRLEEDGPEPVECPDCEGAGRVKRGYGRGERTEACDRCFGDGAVEASG